MLFILFIAVTVVLALATNRRPVVPAIVALGWYTSTPWIATGFFVGDGLPGVSLTAATYFVLIVFFVQVLLNLRDYSRDVLSSPLLAIALLTFIAAAFVFSFFATQTSGVSFLVDQVVAPIALFLIIRRSIALSPASGPRMARWYIGFAVLNAVVAIVVSAGLLAQPFEAYLENYYWYVPELLRPLGLTDHPLVLGAILATAIPLLINLTRAWLQAVWAVLFVVAILLTESRTALILAAAAIAFLVVRGHAPLQARLALLVAMLAAALFYVNTTLSEGVAEKLVDDGGSGQVRTIAIRYVFQHLDRFVLNGGGTGANADVALEAGLGTSLENPFVAYLVDYSLLATVLYFGAQLVIVLQRRHEVRAVAGARLTALVAIVTVQSYMSVATINYSGGLLWIALAFAAAPYPVKKTEDKAATAPQRVSRTRLPSRTR